MFQEPNVSSKETNAVNIFIFNTFGTMCVHLSKLSFMPRLKDGPRLIPEQTWLVHFLRQ
jgi:hypothetical protein